MFYIQEIARNDGQYQGLMVGPYFKDPATYYLLCSDKKHVLSFFDQSSGYFDKDNDHVLTITKYKDFEYFTAYNFAFKYRNLFDKDSYLNLLKGFLGNKDEGVLYKLLHYAEENSYAFPIEIQFLVDKKNGIYCTSSYREAPFNKLFLDNITPETEELYKMIADYYWDLIMTKIAEHETKMSEYSYRIIKNDTNINIAFNVSSKYEPEKGLELSEKIRELQEQEEKTKDIRETKRSLSIYTTPVYRIRPDEGLPKRPEIKGDLPTTDEELKRYLEWINIVYERTRSFGYLIDDFGIDIKFEITEEGLKATSAGSDKKFGTEDDISYIRKYEDTYKIIMQFI